MESPRFRARTNDLDQPGFLEAERGPIIGGITQAKLILETGRF